MTKSATTTNPAAAIYEVRTLGDQGHKLPIGFCGSHELVFREWTTEEELQMSESLGPKIREGRYVDVVLGTMCQRIGGLVIWSDAGPDAKRLITIDDFSLKLREAYLGDVLYSYVLLRRDVMGRTAYFDLKDPFDGNKPVRWPANLETLEVRIPKSQAQLTWRYNLIKPCKLGEKQITHLIMGPALWGSTAMSATSPELETVASAIHGIPEYDSRLTPGSVTVEILARMRMGPIDFKRLFQLCNADQLGPVLSAEYKSPKRPDTPVPFEIDIRYGHFFGASSL